MKNIIFLSLLFIASCTHKLTEGTIVNKTYEPERTRVQGVPITIRTGTSIIVSTVPRVYYEDEEYILLVEGRIDDGEPIQEKFYVTKAVYNSVTIGGYIVFVKENMSHKEY